MTPRKALQKAIAHAGSKRALAHLIGVTPPLIDYWLDHKVTAEKVLLIEMHTPVKRHELRPDLWQAKETAT